MLSKNMSKNVMFSRVYLICGIILMITIEKSVEEFCESYKANNYSIDYQYDHQFRLRGGVLHLFVIDHKYWQISIDHRIDTSDFEPDFELSLNPEEGVSNWFGNQYKSGFTYWSTAHKHLISGLMRRGNTSDEYIIDWGVFDEKNKTGLKYANTSFRKPSKLSLEYKSVVSTSQWSSVVFIMAKNLSSFEYKLIEYQMNETTENILYESNEEPKDHRNGIDLEVIARFEDGFGTRDPELSANQSGFIAYLFKNDKLIEYCIVWADSNEMCSKNSLKTLIDCTQKPNILMKVIKIFVVIIVAIVMTIIGLYLLICHRRRYTNPDADATLDDSSETDPSHSKVNIGFNGPIELSKNTIKISKFKSEEMVPKVTPKQKSKVSPQKNNQKIQ